MTTTVPTKTALSLLKHAMGHLANAQSTIDAVKHHESLTDAERSTAADLAWRIGKVKGDVVTLATNVQSRTETKGL